MTDHEHFFLGDTCECGAKLVVVEPGPVMVKCYYGVVGHEGYVRGSGGFSACNHSIPKDADPPYCPEHLAQMGLRDALKSLEGTTIREIELGHYPAVRVHWSAEGGIVGGVLDLYAEHDERFGDDFVTWSLA